MLENTPTRPNLVFIMPDQLRPDFLPTYGCQGITTPNLDALSAQATVYNRAYSNCPLCVPARAALLTGLNPLRTGVLSNHQWLRPDRHAQGIQTWPELLRAQGYRTASIGKMHFHPFDASEGFDERVIAEDKRWVKIHDDYAEFMAQHGFKKFDARNHPDYAKNMGAVPFPYDVEFTPDRFVSNAAEAFISRQPQGRPFALMIGYPSPHCPYDALPQYAEQVTPSGLPRMLPPLDTEKQGPAAFLSNFITNHKRAWHSLDYTDFSVEARLAVRIQYAGLVKQIDDEIGRIIQVCKDTGNWDNTLFIVSSDHGDHIGDRGLVGKGDFFEESIRIPLIVKHPEQQTAQRLDTPVELQQIPATMLQTAEVALPAYWDYAPLPGDDTPDGMEPMMFGVLSDICMVRRGPWKLIDYDAGNYVELYNTDEDPEEQQDRAGESACLAIQMELGQSLRFWLRQQVSKGNIDKKLPPNLSENPDFARRGWRFAYPHPMPSEVSFTK